MNKVSLFATFLILSVFVFFFAQRDVFAVYVVKDEATCLKVEIQGEKGHCVQAPNPEQGMFCPSGEFGVGTCKASDNIYCCVKGAEVSTENACNTAGGICRDFTSSDACLSNEYIRGKCSINKPCCLPVSGDAFSCQSQIGACVPESDCKTENRIAKASDCPGTKNPGKVCCKSSRDDLCKQIGGTCTTGGAGCPQGTLSKMDCEQKDGKIPACCVVSNSNIAPTSSNSTYTLFEQIPGTPGRTMQFPEYIIALYKFLIWGVVFAAILMVMIGGFWYLTAAGNTSQVGTAKKIISDALLGLVVILFTWLLLSIINPDLVSINLKSLSALKVNILAPSTSPTTGTTTDTPGTTGTTPPPPGSEEQKPPVNVGEGQYSHDEAVKVLKDAGISVSSSGGCSDRNNSQCTSLDGIPKSTISNIISLKNATGCPVTVSGGTEAGHKSHGPGKSVVDLSYNDCLNNKLKSASQYNIVKICSKPPDTNYQCSYSEPARHFHVQFSL